MLSYIRSELFRFFHNKKLYLLIGSLAVLIAAMVSALVFFEKTQVFLNATTAFALGAEYKSMHYLLVLILVLSMYLDDNEHRQHTMKHSAAFGISRGTIYLARYLSQLIAAAVIYILMNILLTGLSSAFLQHSNVGEGAELLRAMAAGLPLFLAALAVSHCFLMNVESQTSAATLAISVILVLPSIMNLLGKRLDLIKELAYWHPYNLAAPFADMENQVMELTWNAAGGMGHCYLSGIVCTLIFTAAGLSAFRRREIR